MSEATTVNTNFTYSVGELVLCYEPDPSKAKLLYDAKVMDLDSTKDSSGQLVPEYYVHFIGWNKSWDRWILESGILKDNETNRALQTRLVNKVVKRSSGKRQRRKRKEQLEDDHSSEERSTVSHSGSDIPGEVENVRNLPLVSISIPLIIKSRLEDDCYNIKRKKKLVSIPRKPSVREILEGYCTKCLREKERSPDAYNAQILRDVIDGLITCFDFMLSTLLLYNMEYDQYYSFFPSANPRKPPVCSTPTPQRGRPKLYRESPVVLLEDIASQSSKTSSLGKEDSLVGMASIFPDSPGGSDTTSKGRVLRSRRSMTRRSETCRPATTKRQRASISPAPKSPSSVVSLTESRDSEASVLKAMDQMRDTCSSTSVTLPCQPGTTNRPSDVYGSEHLIRLFVKLPSILARMDMEDAKLQALLENISGVLSYLADKSNELFPHTAYMDFVH